MEPFQTYCKTVDVPFLFTIVVNSLSADIREVCMISHEQLLYEHIQSTDH